MRLKNLGTLIAKSVTSLGPGDQFLVVTSLVLAVIVNPSFLAVPLVLIYLNIEE